MKRLRHFASAVLVAVSMAVGLADLLATGAASAHDDKGTITVVASEPSGAVVHFEVTITYDNDGHLADDPTATVVAEKAGVTVGPVALVRSASGDRFVADLTFPSSGTWLVRFSALDPVATLETTLDVTIAPPTTAAPSTTRATTAPTTAAPTTPAPTTVPTTAAPTTAVPTTAAPTTVAPTTVAPTTTAANGDDDGGGGAGAAILIGGGVVVAAGAAAFAVRARRRSGR